MEDERDFAVRVARRAGGILMDYYGSKLTKTVKSSPNDFVTEADFASENFILDQIRQHYPNYNVVAEESEKDQRTSGHTWIVDPLDGTYHFAHGIDNFGVLISRATDGEVDIAVAYSPVDGMLATALKGRGVFLDNERIDLADSSSADKPIVANGALHEQLRSVGEVRNDKSAILGVLKSLRGAYKAHVSNKGYIWDHAPATLMLAEAGWKVTNVTGGHFLWDAEIADGYPGIIAAPEAIHDQIRDALG